MEASRRLIGYDRPGARWSANLEYKPADCWIGLYWRNPQPGFDGSLPVTLYEVWVCLLPMLPIHISWIRPREKGEWDEA